MNKKILTAILISIALPGSMLSAPADSLRLKSYKLDEVVVTGTRNETDIRHLPMTISVVGCQQLEQTYQPSILPALTEQVPDFSPQAAASWATAYPREPQEA